MVYINLRAMDLPRRDVRGDPDLPGAPPPQLSDRQRQTIPSVVADVHALLARMSSPALPAPPSPALHAPP